MFEDPISLPGGRQLVTLEDAGNPIQKLPEAEQLLKEWQAGSKPCSWSSSSTGRP
jgi:hypothetical protein